MPETLQLVWALLVVAAVLALAYLATRFLGGRMGAGARLRRGRVTVLEQIPLGRDQKLLLVRMGGFLYLLGVTQGGITRLEKIPEEKLAGQEGEPSAGRDQPPSFSEALKKVLEQRKKSGRP